MSEAIDIYTLLFLVLAVVIFIRLRSVLGRRTGSERPPYDPYTRTDEKQPDGTVVALPRGRADHAPKEAQGPRQKILRSGSNVLRRRTVRSGNH